MKATARLLPALALLGTPVAAAAHSAPAGWSYDAWCCGGHDCQPIAHEAVSVTDEGYLVTLPEGSHRTARRMQEKLFGYDEVQQSGDELYHACILPGSQEFRCLYVPQFTY